jgi:hypothetical protein
VEFDFSADPPIYFFTVKPSFRALPKSIHVGFCVLRFSEFYVTAIPLLRRQESEAIDFTARVRTGTRVGFLHISGNVNHLEAKAWAKINAFDDSLGSPLGAASYSGNLPASISCGTQKLRTQRQ